LGGEVGVGAARGAGREARARRRQVLAPLCGGGDEGGGVSCDQRGAGPTRPPLARGRWGRSLRLWAGGGLSGYCCRDACCATCVAQGACGAPANQSTHSRRRPYILLPGMRSTMKQLFFDGKGQLLVEDVPAPGAPENGALVRVAASLISSGTEMTLTAGGGSLIRRALEQRQLIKRAFEMALRQGVRFTAGEVQNIAETWFPAGYSAAGTVVEPGREAGGLQPGDRVACAGAGHANHAEYDAVPLNLLARIPEEVTFRQAAFTTVGTIALQGVRRAEVTLGETVVVVGLGLIGQITAQILDAAGCIVIGSDPIAERRELAARLAGAHSIDPTLGDAARQVMALTNGVGADKVILCAATTSSQPTNEAFEMCRERGRVVMAG